MDDDSGRWRGDFMNNSAMLAHIGWSRPSGRHLVRLLVAVASIMAAFPSTIHGQTAENVAVVVNDNSADSQRIAERYAQVRQLPASNIFRIKTSTDETIERNAYLKTIEQPISLAIKRAGLQDRLLYLVLTKGVPLRIAGTTGLDGTLASVDSELTLLYRRMVGQSVPAPGKVDNPYFLGDRPISQAFPFTHREHDIYLVTRLDGFTVDEALALIDRAQAPAPEGSVVLDRRGAGGASSQWLEATADRLTAQGQRARFLESPTVSSPDEAGVLGYYSARASDVGSAYREASTGLATGSIAATFTSFDARTFRQPPEDWRPTTSGDKKMWFEGSGAPLIGDLIRGGVTGVAGQVGEPYLLGAVRPQILFPAYLAGFNLAEAFYLAIPSLSWQTVVIGDPLCAPVRRNPFSRDQLEEATSDKTGLPGLFAKRRLAALTAANREVPEAAVAQFLRSQTLLERDDRAGARRALEEAVKLAPRAAGLVTTLAQLEEQAGDYDAAIEHYRLAIDAQPSNVVALNNLAFALAVRRGAAAEALPFAKRAASLAPRAGTVLDTLGWIEHLTGNDAAAANELNKAVQLAPGEAEIRLHAAIVYAAIEKGERAEKELKEALLLDPSLADRDEVRQLREGIKSPARP